MRLYYGIILVFMVFVSACAQQPAATQAPTQQEQPRVETQPAVGIPEDEVEEEEEIAPVPEISTTEVILLRGSVEPEELVISSGSFVTLGNDGGLPTVVTIFKDGVSYMNTPLLNDGDRFG